MRALVYNGQLRLDKHFPDPQLGEGEALLRIRKAGICNTDLELIDGMYEFAGVLGHEFVADVIEGPPQLIGRRVVGEINIGCGLCDFCQQNIISQCRQRKAVGIHDYPGAFADYLVLPVTNLYPVADAITDDMAVFTEPLAAALQVQAMAHISPHDRVVVLGVGKLGMLVAQVLKLSGAEVIGAVRHSKQKQLLERWGIPAVHTELDEIEAGSAQVVVDCTGQAAGFTDALDLVQPRGTIILKSTYRGQPKIDMTRVAVEEIHVIGSRCGSFDAALRLLEQKLVDVESLIDGRYALEDAQDALEMARQQGMLKVLIDIIPPKAAV